MKNSKIILPLSAVLSVFLFTGCNHQPSMYSYETFPKNPNYTIYKPHKDRQFSEDNLACMIKELEGKPYVWAEEGPYCFDCSGYLYYMFSKMGVDIPRVAREQFKEGKPVAIEDLKFGDFIFFDTTRNKVGKITHVGIYLKDGWFSHASSADKKITYGNLYTSEYYRDRFRGARRYFEDNVAFQPKMQNYIAQAATATQGITKPAIASTAEKEEKTIVMAQAENKEAGSAASANIQAQQPIDMTISEKTPAEAPAAKIASATTAGEPVLNTISETTNQKQSVAKEEIKPSKQYYVQVGKFQHKPDKVFLKKIRSQGYAYTIMPTNENGKVASKLLIGPFKTKNDANNTLISVKENIVKEAFVTKVSS